MKSTILTTLGVTGTFVAQMLGGWDTAMQTLLIFMAVDYITGLLLAGVFKGSPKTENGALESKAGYKGLVKKGIILLLVLVATRLDCLLVLEGTIRTGVIIAFAFNEAISIIENAGLMGVPIPTILKQTIELLNKDKE